MCWDEWCAITYIAEVLRNKWHPMIVHRLLQNGPFGFNALKDEVDEISGTALSNNLDDLEGNGIVDRSIMSEKPVRVKYSVTERGDSLGPVIDAMAEWGQEYLEPSAQP